MNLAIRGIESNIDPKNADTFHGDLHKDLKADYIIANPPFNIFDWGGERLHDDMRWKYGSPPAGNANFAWVQHIVHHLYPTRVDGFVLANGSMSSTADGEDEIRQRLIEEVLVDCMVALPGQLFHSTQISVCLVCLWFLVKDRSNSLMKHSKLHDRRGEILFIDARKLGYMADRTHHDLDPVKDIRYIVDASIHSVVKKLSMRLLKRVIRILSVSVSPHKEHGYFLTPGRYVGTEEIEDDGIPFEEKMQVLT